MYLSSNLKKVFSFSLAFLFVFSLPVFASAASSSEDDSPPAVEAVPQPLLAAAAASVYGSQDDLFNLAFWINSTWSVNYSTYSVSGPVTSPSNSWLFRILQSSVNTESLLRRIPNLFDGWSISSGIVSYPSGLANSWFNRTLGLINNIYNVLGLTLGSDVSNISSHTLSLANFFSNGNNGYTWLNNISTFTSNINTKLNTTNSRLSDLYTALGGVSGYATESTLNDILGHISVIRTNSSASWTRLGSIISELQTLNSVDFATETTLSSADSHLSVVRSNTSAIWSRLGDIINLINSSSNSFSSLSSDTGTNVLQNILFDTGSTWRHLNSLSSGWVYHNNSYSYPTGFSGSWYTQVLIAFAEFNSYIKSEFNENSAGTIGSYIHDIWNELHHANDTETPGTLAYSLKMLQLVLADEQDLALKQNQEANTTQATNTFLSGSSSGTSLGVQDISDIGSILSSVGSFFSSGFSLGNTSAALNSMQSDGLGFWSQSVKDELNPSNGSSGSSGTFSLRRSSDEVIDFYSIERDKVNELLDSFEGDDSR